MPRMSIIIIETKKKVRSRVELSIGKKRRGRRGLNHYLRGVIITKIPQKVENYFFAKTRAWGGILLMDAKIWSGPPGYEILDTRMHIVGCIIKACVVHHYTIYTTREAIREREIQ